MEDVIRSKSALEDILEEIFPSLYQNESLHLSEHNYEGLPELQLTEEIKTQIDTIVSVHAEILTEAATVKSEMNAQVTESRKKLEECRLQIMSEYGLISNIDIPLQHYYVPQQISHNESIIRIQDCIPTSASAHCQASNTDKIVQGAKPARPGAAAAGSDAPLQMNSDDLESNRRLLQRMRSRQDYIRRPIYDAGRDLGPGPICISDPSSLIFHHGHGPTSIRVTVSNPTTIPIRYRFIRPRSPIFHMVMSKKNVGDLAPGMSMKFHVHYRPRSSEDLPSDIQDQIAILSCQSAHGYIIPIHVNAGIYPMDIHSQDGLDLPPDHPL